MAKKTVSNVAYQSGCHFVHAKCSARGRVGVDGEWVRGSLVWHKRDIARDLDPAVVGEVRCEGCDEIINGGK